MAWYDEDIGADVWGEYEPGAYHYSNAGGAIQMGSAGADLFGSYSPSQRPDEYIDTWRYHDYNYGGNYGGGGSGSSSPGSSGYESITTNPDGSVNIAIRGDSGGGYTQSPYGQQRNKGTGTNMYSGTALNIPSLGSGGTKKRGVQYPLNPRGYGGGGGSYAADTIQTRGANTLNLFNMFENQNPMPTYTSPTWKAPEWDETKRREYIREAYAPYVGELRSAIRDAIAKSGYSTSPTSKKFALEGAIREFGQQLGQTRGRAVQEGGQHYSQRLERDWQDALTQYGSSLEQAKANYQAALERWRAKFNVFMR